MATEAQLQLAINRLQSQVTQLESNARTVIQSSIDKVQAQIDQLGLTNKGALTSLEFRMEAILQANLDTFWLLMCSILVFLMPVSYTHLTLPTKRIV